MNIIDKLQQVQALRQLLDELEDNVRDTMDYNIETTTQFSYDEYKFLKIENQIVSFKAYKSYNCGRESATFEISVDEFLGIINNNKKLEYKTTN